jgi:hypothetical protein
MFKTHRYLPAYLLAAGLVVSAPACASSSYGYQRDGYRDGERRAYQNGFEDGARHGERDARDRRSFSYERDSDYRDADRDFHRGDGDREYYRRSFRQGYQAGYTEGFNRVARAYGSAYPAPAPYGYPPPAPYGYPNRYPSAGRPGFNSPAGQNGFRDGLEVGRDDARDRDPFDPIRSKRYRSGDHDYNDRYGPREEYKREYRAAFQRGYEQGYRDYRR